MYTIIGAAGQVGSAIVKNLLAKQKSVKAIVHSAKKGDALKKQGAQIAVADAFDKQAISDVTVDTDTLFVITPETGKNDDVISDTKTILANYRNAADVNSIGKVVGLSSVGAHLGGDTGNLKMSSLLEHAFNGLNISQVFIRPVYYFSNWLQGIDQIKTTGILPTFFPVDLAIPMISPQDVAKLSADIMLQNQTGKVIFELEGPAQYSSNNVADALSIALQKQIKAQQIPREEWETTLKKMSFSADGAKNFIAMTNIVINGQAIPERKNTTVLQASTTLQQFIDQNT